MQANSVATRPVRSRRKDGAKPQQQIPVRRAGLVIPLAAAFAVAALALGAASQGARAAAKVTPAACVACHGAHGLSQTPGVPSLAGEPDQFLEWQLVLFRSGARDNPLMSPVAQKLSDDDIHALGQYFSDLKPPSPPAGKLDPDLMAAGVAVVQKYNCASCHGSNFAGKGETARLASQREDYIAKALQDFKSGARRGAGAAGAMSSVGFSMTKPEIKAAAYYLSHHP
jgi:cytochrome c553